MTKEEKFLICDWFARIAQMADDRKTVKGYVMPMKEALAEIRSLAGGSREFVETHWENPDAFIIKR